MKITMMRDLINLGLKNNLEPIGFHEEKMLWSHRLGGDWRNISKRLRIALLVGSSIPFLVAIAMYFWLLYTNPDLYFWLLLGLFMLPFLLHVERFTFFEGLEYKMYYGITSDRVVFLEKPKEGLGHQLFFKDIARIDIVGYEDSNTSTIYFITKHEVGFRGYDFEREEKRMHPTFEEIPNGKMVHDLLMQQWRLANRT